MPDDVLKIFADGRVDAKSLSEFVFKPADFMVKRRLAPPINTLQYHIDRFEQVANDGAAQITQAIINSGFIIVDSFGIGATLTQRNQVLRDASNDRLYRWAGDLPKVVPKSSTVASTGGTGDNAWLEVSDATLRQDLLGIGGASKIGNAMSYFSDLASFNAAETAIKDGSSVFLYSLHQGLDLEGEGRVYTYSKTASNGFIEIKTPLGYLSRKFDGKVFIAEHGATGGDYTLDSAALDKCFTNIRNSVGGGILSMGIKCTYHLEGTFYANASYLDWQFNKSAIFIGDFLVRWFPNKLGYTSHNQVKMSAGIFKKGTRAIAEIQLGLVKVDNIEVSGCDFYEVMDTGHFLDLMGSRFIEFHHNRIFGLSKTNPTRVYAEFVQISEAVTSSGAGGATLTPEERTYWDGLPTTDVHFHHNIFMPYTNPETGVKTYPLRPVGDHMDQAFNRNIHINHNYFEDIASVHTEASNIRNAIIGLKSIDETYIHDNTFVIKDMPNSKVITVATSGSSASTEVTTTRVRIKDNIILSNIAAGSMPDDKEHWAIYVSHFPGSDIALDAVVKDNDIKINLGVKAGQVSYGVLVSRGDSANNNKSYIIDNDITLVGGFAHGVYHGRGSGLEVVKNNDFYGLLTQQTIYSRKTSGYGKTIIDNNRFHKQWKSIWTFGHDIAICKDNVLEGHSATPFGGTEDTSHPHSGTAASIAIDGIKVASSGNIVIDDTRTDNIKIKGVFVTPPEWQFNIVP